MFEGWSEYYLVVGSAAGALIGLLFVVVTLTQGYERSRAMMGVSLYMTPTAVHFAVVLTIGALATAPRLAAWTAVLVVGTCAVAGLVNAVHAALGIRKFRTTSQEPPHWTDFWAYGALPAVLYAGLGAVATGLWSSSGWAVDATGVLALSLLLLGIRNAWDLVTWMAPRADTDGADASGNALGAVAGDEASADGVPVDGRK